MLNLPIEERWVSIALGGVPMERINPLFFYHLGALLKPLTKMDAQPSTRIDVWRASFDIDPAVRTLLDFYSALTVCRRTGVELVNAAAEVRKWMDETPPKEWQKADYSVDTKFRYLIDKAKEFQTVLSEELQMLVTYHVTKKGIYSTDDLIEHAERTLPTPVLEKMNKGVIEEIRQSGRCLAFDNSTAAGFHIIRAIEALIHDYYVLVCKPASEKKLDNWGAYISALHKLSEDTDVKKSIREDVKKVIALLQQIKDQDRNLIMHPQVVLTPDDAHKLFEIGTGAIIAIADKLPASKKNK